ncbi:MAG: hypothetical protein ACOVQE_06355 [Chitinophagaceae bacterium]
MKKAFYSLSTLFVLLLSSFTIANDPSKDILGRWKIDDAHTGTVAKYIIESTRAKNPEMAQQMEENFEMVVGMIQGIVIEYKADGSLITETPQGNQNATYSFDDNFKSLIVKRPNGTQRKDSILELSATRLKLINRERGDTTLFVKL